MTKNIAEICLIIALLASVLAAISNLSVIYFDAIIIDNQALMLDQQINITQRLSVYNEESMALIEAHLKYIELKNKYNEDQLNIAINNYDNNTNISKIESAKNDSKGHRAAIEEKKSVKENSLIICIIINILALIFICAALWFECTKVDNTGNLSKLINNEDIKLATIENECKELKSSIKKVLEKLENNDRKLAAIDAERKEFENSLKTISHLKVKNKYFHGSGKFIKSGKIAFSSGCRKRRGGKGRV